jgi:hypothetical protein
MTIHRIVTPLLCLSSVLYGCSSENPAPASTKLTPPVDQPITVPPEPAAPGPIQLVIQGQGTVGADDGSASCKSDGTTAPGTCTLPHPDVTLYAYRAYGWQFDRWEPSNSHDGSLYIGRAAPTTITAVFKPIVILDVNRPD